MGLGLGKLMQFLSHKLQEFKNLRADGVGAEGLDFIVMPGIQYTKEAIVTVSCMAKEA